MQSWPFRYTLRCQKRNDLDPTLGTLPDHSLYIGSSNNISARLCFHFQSDDHGSTFTRQFQPLAVEQLCVMRSRNTKECLKWEDEMVIENMYKFMQIFTHPQAWRAVAGGSWAKSNNTRMPFPLQQKLRTATVKWINIYSLVSTTLILDFFFFGDDSWTSS